MWRAAMGKHLHWVLLILPLLQWTLLFKTGIKHARDFVSPSCRYSTPEMVMSGQPILSGSRTQKASAANISRDGHQGTTPGGSSNQKGLLCTCAGWCRWPIAIGVTKHPLWALKFVINVTFVRQMLVSDLHDRGVRDHGVVSTQGDWNRGRSEGFWTLTLGGVNRLGL